MRVLIGSECSRAIINDNFLVDSNKGHKFLISKKSHSNLQHHNDISALQIL